MLQELMRENRPATVVPFFCRATCRGGALLALCLVLLVGSACDADDEPETRVVYKEEVITAPVPVIIPQERVMPEAAPQQPMVVVQPVIYEQSPNAAMGGAPMRSSGTVAVEGEGDVPLDSLVSTALRSEQGRALLRPVIEGETTPQNQNLTTRSSRPTDTTGMNNGSGAGNGAALSQRALDPNASVAGQQGTTASNTPNAQRTNVYNPLFYAPSGAVVDGGSLTPTSMQGGGQVGAANQVYQAGGNPSQSPQIPGYGYQTTVNPGNTSVNPTALPTTGVTNGISNTGNTTGSVNQVPATGNLPSQVPTGNQGVSQIPAGVRGGQSVGGVPSNGGSSMY